LLTLQWAWGERKARPMPDKVLNYNYFAAVAAAVAACEARSP